ncbi:MarR family winged helix-turn-helix transcriptional regulator [Deinococcus petrolearius]|uniref:MarR family winged helix-turn-helix transcriptional regulator n=1 Tax=Deinococcus petrolearius TaxID=1751295 RepID=A0ABW1DL68_9DEIO
MPSAAPPAATVLATRLLEAHYGARDAFTRLVDPLLRERYDLDMRDFMILRWIGEQELTPGSLAQLLHIPGYATSRLLDPFIKRNLVRREVTSADARRYRLHLTPEGHDVLQGINETLTEMVGKFIQELGAERFELLIEGLDALTRIDAKSFSHPKKDQKLFDASRKIYR